MPIPLERLGGARRDVRAEADELRRLRSGFGLTQPQMALLLDVSADTYHRWERGLFRCQWTALELMRVWAREAEAAKGKRKGRR